MQLGETVMTEQGEETGTRQKENKAHGSGYHGNCDNKAVVIIKTKLEIEDQEQG